MSLRRQYDAALRRNARIPEGFSLAPRPTRLGGVMNHCPCDTREKHPVSECVAPGQTNNEVFAEDVRAIAVALGLGSHARPYSAHAVVHRELLPALRSLPLPECPTHAVCPNCREGWGHWNGERYQPTEQSRAADRKAAESA